MQWRETESGERSSLADPANAKGHTHTKARGARAVVQVARAEEMIASGWPITLSVSPNR